MNSFNANQGSGKCYRGSGRERDRGGEGRGDQQRTTHVVHRVEYGVPAVSETMLSGKWPMVSWA